MGVHFDQAVVFAILAAALVFFIWGRWRCDPVAIAILVAVPLILYLWPMVPSTPRPEAVGLSRSAAGRAGISGQVQRITP
jgi:hypothetical protein